MQKDAKIFVAGHRGLVGSALVRGLNSRGFHNLLLRTHAELDLARQEAVDRFFETEKPEYVFLAAAKVGGILANNQYPAQFIYQNLMIQTHVIDAAWRHGVQRLLFLGSSCIYPKQAPQPMKEEYLLTGPLEATNRPYALAKIAGIEQCWSYNRQYGTHFLAVMPTNLYGPGDHYDLSSSHVIPALLRKFHEARETSQSQVSVWGSGTPRREFLYSDDMADACITLMQQSNEIFTPLLGSDEAASNIFMPPVVNIGCGEDVTIRQLAELVREVVGFTGEIIFDSSKPDGTPRKLLDVSRLSAMGWKPRVTLREGLERAYRDYLDTQQ